MFVELGDERSFAKKVVKIYKALFKLDSVKYLQPQMSYPICDLATYLKNTYSVASNSTALSTASFLE